MLAEEWQKGKRLEDGDEGGVSRVEGLHRGEPEGGRAEWRCGETGEEQRLQMNM